MVEYSESRLGEEGAAAAAPETAGLIHQACSEMQWSPEQPQERWCVVSVCMSSMTREGWWTGVASTFLFLLEGM